MKKKNETQITKTDNCTDLHLYVIDYIKDLLFHWHTVSCNCFAATSIRN